MQDLRDRHVKPLPDVPQGLGLGLHALHPRLDLDDSPTGGSDGCRCAPGVDEIGRRARRSVELPMRTYAEGVALEILPACRNISLAESDSLADGQRAQGPSTGRNLTDRLRNQGTHLTKGGR